MLNKHHEKYGLRQTEHFKSLSGTSSTLLYDNSLFQKELRK